MVNPDAVDYKYKVTMREPYRPAYRQAFYESAEQTITLADKSSTNGALSCTGVTGTKKPLESITQ
jgi:hypothetical protein